MKIQRLAVAARNSVSIGLRLVCAGGLLAACTPEVEPARPPRPVKAMQVADQSSLSERALPGRASAGQEVNLSFRVAGPLIEFPVAVGDRVEAGQVVARIDPRDYQSAVDARVSELQMAQAAATRAQADFTRIENTFRDDPGATSQMALDRARQLRDSAAASVRALRATSSGTRDQLGYTSLEAPFGGEVVETYVENFETVVPKQPILRIVDSSSIEFVVSVPENLIGYADRVTDIRVSFDALPGVSVPASIAEVGKEATQATRTYPVTLRMAQPDGAEILPGMAGEALISADLPAGARELGMQIPATAVFTQDDPTQSFVWVIDESTSKLVRRQVETGALSEFGVLVRSGLEAGEWIVVAGVSSLDEGDEVKRIDGSDFMNLTAAAIERKTLTNFVVFLVVAGGVFSYFNLGRLEDPDFTVKTGVVITQYPGASPAEVELEVTDRIEQAIQEMPQLDSLYSFSRAGLSIVKVDMKQEYWADRLPQVWDEMRKKIRDVTPQFPPGVMKSEIIDDFSFVFGFVLAITGDGFTYAELEKYTKDLRKELSLVPGVSRVDLWGVQPKVIYLDISEAQLAALRITSEDVLATLALQNMVVSSGSIEVPGLRMRVETAGEFQRPEDIGNLVVRRSIGDTAALALREGSAFSRQISESLPTGSTASGSSAAVRASEVIRIRDIATVREGYLEPPFQLMRYEGQPALALQIANVSGGNIIDTGAGLDARLAELLPQLPAGIEVTKFTWQSDLVAESINGFVINLVEAVLIVLGVLALAMGLRMGLVIGWALIVTILGTFVAMLIMDISLQRVSLGALVVALGMMVDNAIVVADNYSVRLARGMKPVEAAIESAAKPSIALLGATLVAVMAFYPVYAARTDAGEYGRGLFVVVGISLIISWVVSMTMTPLNCMAFLKAPEGASEDADPYDTGFFRAYRTLLEGALRARALTVAGMVGLLALAIWGFTGVPQQFFPDSTRAQFMIDYWAPQGTPIQDVSAGLAGIEAHLAGDERVKDIGTFIGSGGPRFYLPVDPEFPYASFGQLIVNTPSFAEVDPLVSDLVPWLEENYPDILTRVRKYTVGPGDTWPFELRISGPAEADLDTLRRLGAEGTAILKQSPLAKHVRTDMRQRVQKVVIDFDQERARWSAVTRGQVAEATRRAYDGTPVGLYREGDAVLPIIARGSEAERARAPSQLELLQVQPTLSLDTLPLGQVTEGIRLEWEDPIITRFNRRRQIAVQAAPNGTTFPALRSSVIDQFEAIELPPGYSLKWDGEYDSTTRAQLSLIPGMVPAVLIMTLIIVALFNAVKPSLIIAMVIPFALIGITAILLPTQTPFGFMAMIGAMSLVGLMIKNSIVLLDEIEANRTGGMEAYQATVAAGMSRVRPVALGAATTVLGVMPLIQDAFWVSMALTMMFGLAFGTGLTMILVPTFYAALNRLKAPAPGEGAD